MTKKISLQDIFDAAWQAFIVEDRPPAIGYNGACKYLTEDGKKCAVGLVLPDGHPAQGSGCLFNGLVKGYPDLWDDDVLALCDQNSNRQLAKFQWWLHDNMCNRGGWTQSKPEREAIYRQVAFDYGLTVPGETNV